MILRNKENQRKHHKCKYCGNDIDYNKLSIYSSGEFCSIECSKKYVSNLNRDRTHEILCSSCGKQITVRFNILKSTCENCRKERIKERLKYRLKEIKTLSENNSFLKNNITKNVLKCKYCGANIGECIHPEICKQFRLFPSLIKYFDFDSNVIGTEKLYVEWNRIKQYIIEEYFVNEKSVKEIASERGYVDAGNFAKILKHFINLRTRNEGKSNFMFHHGLEKQNNKNECQKFLQGNHKTWDGKEVFYRSSYELDYCKELDEKQICYDMESLRIRYFDSSKNKLRVSIPDFYLIDENMIVEIKSLWTYDKQNMIYRYKAYHDNGYKFKLIIEHIEYEEDSFINLTNDGKHKAFINSFNK